ncbi:MAG: hypothetical protein OXI77_13870 [Chloroflexota bacterium]|nr:hypothetical protein [Chloroflexota bacterium]MDE2909085.1 hypothetical protein [Chloroflexota bacterium]
MPGSRIDNKVNYRKVFVFWLPLAMSWLLMTFEGLWIQGVIGRKPDAETQLAAFGLMFSLSVLIETPVIMLLATSNALSRDRQSYRILWRFMMGVNSCVIAIAVLMAFTPLLDLYLGALLKVPSHIIDATRPGMKIMILWGGFIGYRRFHQGIIIRAGKTRYVAYGTVLRALVSGVIALGLGAITAIAGAAIGAIALALAMAAETLYTYVISRTDVNRLLATPRNSALRNLTQRDALRFHLPLAATSVITILVSPVIERGLASMPDAAQSLAAWPVIFTILLIARSGGIAYQEVVISLNDSEARHLLLRKFTIYLGLALSLIMTLFAFTPAILFYLRAMLQVPAHLQGLVLIGAQAGIMLPLMTTLQSYLRALLMLSHRTGVIYQAIVIGFVLTAATVWGGIGLGLHGILAASLGLSVGMAIELAYLYAAYRRGHAALRLHWQSAVAPSMGS